MSKNPSAPSSCPSSSTSAGAVGRTLCQLTLWLAASILTASAAALPSDAAQPIHIEAENAEIDQKNQRLTYRGSVQITQGSLRVTAREMVVEYEEQGDEQTVTRIKAIGTPAHYTQQLEADEGEVKANASTIIYHTKKGEIDLEGDAHLEQQGNVITGDVIHYDMVAGRVDASSESDAGIKMVLKSGASLGAPAKPKE